MDETIQQTLLDKNPADLKDLFAFDNEANEVVAIKFNLWARHFFSKYFSSEDAPFHEVMDMNNVKAYRGQITSFVNIQFRGSGKTVRTKLFMAFCICNDQNHFRKYIKVLSQDGNNSKQIVTDVYNMLVQPEVVAIYPEIFRKSNQKREETMSSFTTATGIKIIADTVGTSQRGAIQEDSRPDLIWFEDIEDRMTLRSAVKTKAIADAIEEARTGLAKGGSTIATCNYISERGNVHIMATRQSYNKEVLIVPIIKNGIPTWDRFTIAEIDQMRMDDDDFEGERLCQPSASKDVMFDRETIEKMEIRSIIRSVAGFNMYRTYDASHRYASGHDIAGGVGLDSSTSVFIDFDTMPAQVVATYANNEIKPDIFGDEIKREAEYYGECLVAPEKNNHGHATIGRLKQIYPLRKIHKTQKKDTRIERDDEPTEYGWHTNAVTKPKMMFDLVKAVNNGLLVLNCPALIAEARGYTRNDLMDTDVDPRLTTRHFDLLIACAIAFQMKDFVNVAEQVRKQNDEIQRIMESRGFDPYSVLD